MTNTTKISRAAHQDVHARKTEFVSFEARSYYSVGAWISKAHVLALAKKRRVVGFYTKIVRNDPIGWTLFVSPSKFVTFPLPEDILDV